MSVKYEKMANVNHKISICYPTKKKFSNNNIL